MRRPSEARQQRNTPPRVASRPTLLTGLALCATGAGRSRGTGGHRGTGSNMPDTAHAEAFNARLRAECLNASWFLSLADARDRLKAWRRDYCHASQHPS